MRAEGASRRDFGTDRLVSRMSRGRRGERCLALQRLLSEFMGMECSRIQRCGSWVPKSIESLLSTREARSLEGRKNSLHQQRSVERCKEKRECGCKDKGLGRLEKRGNGLKTRKKGSIPVCAYRSCPALQLESYSKISKKVSTLSCHFLFHNFTGDGGSEGENGRDDIAGW
jgi:hypothetical protein